MAIAKRKFRAILTAEQHSLRLQGVAAILFGVAAMIWPGITINVLVYLFAVLLLVYGVVHAAVASMNIKRSGKYVLLLLVGLAEVVLGVYLLQSPDMALDTFALILAFIFIFRGVFTVVRSIRLYASTMRITQILLGAIEILIATVLFIFPLGSIVALVWIVGLYALIAGLIMLAMAADITKTKRVKSSVRMRR